ncbi:hypothetical protein DPMN_031247 [Dreissena polymorpha]|uniref:Tyr recombinase domain-containing protein n=1 Tax=Dreissena polymorpha TaxID=45954 RepID=A0A9D4RHV3_DREPO|nr:hypothetical protein DPMN_031247 [Dreissena polymorpha]
MRSENFLRQSQVFDNSTPVANTNLVFKTNGNDYKGALHSSGNQKSSISTTLRSNPSAGKRLSSDCMSSVRESFRCQGFSRRATKILMSSWRSGTQKQYQTYISRWFQYCDKCKIDSVSVSVKDVVEFLTEEFERGVGYSALNTARGALSSFLRLENVPAGSHPVVIRFMKGVFNLRPCKSKYTKTWDVQNVLTYLKSLSPVKHLSLKELTLKLVMLIALTNAARSQTVHLLSVNKLIKEKSQFVVQFDSLLKQSRPGFDYSVLLLKCYPPDRRLCVYTVMKEYLSRTKKVRPSTNKKLLISYIRPHGPVSKDTVSRWIRTVMIKSGIDVTVYGAHSVRSASTSKARDNNVPISVIMKRAGWTADSTFKKYYSLNIENDSMFENAVLQ